MVMPKKKQSETKQTFTPIGTSAASDDYWDSWTLQTRIPPLDHVLSGGVGCRRMAEIYGQPGSGKSAVGYHLLASVEQVGGTGILIDSEGAFNRAFYESLGGNPDKLQIANEAETDTVEFVFEFIKKNAEAYGELGLDVPPLFILWDSIAATTTMHLQDAKPGTRDLSKSTAMSAGLQRILPSIRSSNVCLLSVNQTYQVIGSYVPTHTTPGGDRYKFIASQRIFMKYNNSDIIYDEDKTHIGHKVTTIIEKSRMGNPHQRANLWFYTVEGAKHPVYDRTTKFGFDVDQSLFDYYQTGAFFIGEDKGRVVQSNGGWYSLHKSIDTEQKKFRAKDWPEQLDKFPQLKDLIYHDLEIPTI
jgi:recombination protein RecA